MTESNQTDVEHNVEQELGTDETLLKRAVQWKQQGKTYREIEDGLGVPKSTLHRYLKRNAPNTRVEPMSHGVEQNGEDGIEEREEPQDVSQHSSLPSGTLVFEQGDLEAIRGLIPKAHQATYIAHVDVVSKRQRLGYRNNGHDNNGYGRDATFHSENYIDSLGRLVDKVAMQKQAERIVEKMFPSEKNDSELSRRLDRIENKLDNGKQGSELLQVAKALTELSRPRGEAVNPMEYVSAGVNLRADVEKNVQNQFSVGVQKGEADVKIEDMRQHERIDMRRLDLAEKELDHKLAHEGDTMKTVENITKNLTSGVVGDVIKGIGSAAAGRINSGGRIPLADVLCPSCSNKFKANARLASIQCPSCGAILTKQEQPQTVPEQPQQPEQTQQEKPLEPQTQEAKPEGSPSKYGVGEF